MWLSSKIFYKPVEVYKKNIFGVTVRKRGYELTRDLRWKIDKGRFAVLKKGYVWDGSSYPRVLEWLIGKKRLPAILAASAFHDTAKKLPVRYIGNRKIFHLNYKIKDGAKLYKEMMLSWPIQSERPKEYQAKIQNTMLPILQPVYALFNGKDSWKKVIDK